MRSIYPLLTALCSLSALTAQVAGQQTGYFPPKGYFYFGYPHEILEKIAPYLPEDPVIVDAGAYDGKDAKRLANRWPKGKVHSFEPVRELYIDVAANTKGIENISVYHLALGGQSGKAVMHISREPHDLEHVSMSSSLFTPKEHLKYADALFRETQEVDVITLDDWAAQNGLEKVDMLWLDMQGAELDAMKAASKLLPKVSVVITEIEFVEAYAGQPLYYEIREWLESQGFALIGGSFHFPRQKHEWFADGFFVRKELIRE